MDSPPDDPTPASSPRVVVLGAGPAGLAAATTLCRRGGRVDVLEASAAVGGISRTVERDGYYFDLGGHRFFTRFSEVQALWESVLGADFLERPRLSRILYGGRLYDYPLRASNALRNLGPVESARCVVSFARAQLRPRGREASFEEWVSNRFGDRLFDIFFRSYTEKVWGIPTSEIGAEWASQRIKNLDLGTALLNMLPPRLRPGGPVVPSLIETFHYPRRGPGMMYDRMAAQVEAMGGRVHRLAPAVRLERTGFRVDAVVTGAAAGSERTWAADAVLSSIPLPVLVQAFSPAAPEAVIHAAQQLRFRHLLSVNLIVDHPDLFPDNWVYVHAPGLKVGRIQNFKNWSPEMVPDPTKTSLGLEYFCSDGDALWSAGEAELVALGTEELRASGLLRGARVIGGSVARAPRAYPVYQRGYQAHLDVVVAWLRRFENVQAMGRYGMFKYNNADHSILTAILAVENLYGATHDVWRVNTDTEYHEVRGAVPGGR